MIDMLNLYSSVVYLCQIVSIVVLFYPDKYDSEESLCFWLNILCAFHIGFFKTQTSQEDAFRSDCGANILILFWDAIS